MTKVILGGGLSGLSASYYALKRSPTQTTIVEASNRVGGWLKSRKQEDGTIFEQAARTIRPKGKPGINTLQLVEELGLSGNIVPVPSTSPAASNRMIYVNGKLHSLPSSFFSLFRTQTPFTKPLIYYLFNEIRSPVKIATNNDESLYSFINRRLGSEIADYLISPIVCGVCGGDAKEISVKFLLESLFVKEQTYGSITRGLLFDAFHKNDTDKSKPATGLVTKAKQEKWNVYSFNDGIEILPKALKHKIELMGGKIKLNTKIDKIELNKNFVVVHTNRGDVHTANHLISTISAENLSLLLQDQHKPLANMLSNIPNASMCVVNLKYNKKLIKKDGFGFLVSPKENLPILGIIYDSCCFPRGDKTVLTVMMGGFNFDKYFTSQTKSEDVIKTALVQIENILGISDQPDSYKVNILPKCIPQYVVGHYENLKQINKYISDNELPLVLCGSSYYGVGVNDVILSAKNAVDTL